MLFTAPPHQRLLLNSKLVIHFYRLSCVSCALLDLLYLCIISPAKARNHVTPLVLALTKVKDSAFYFVKASWYLSLVTLPGVKFLLRDYILTKTAWNYFLQLLLLAKKRSYSRAPFMWHVYNINCAGNSRKGSKTSSGHDCNSQPRKSRVLSWSLDTRLHSVLHTQAFSPFN